MPRSIFGWDYPPGCSGPPKDDIPICSACDYRIDDCRCVCEICEKRLDECFCENSPFIVDDLEEHQEIVDAVLGKEDEDE